MSDLFSCFLILFIFLFQMSAGLMSCVRENSPPLEMGDGSNMSIPPGTPGKKNT